jgi:hypothetical protein
MMCCKVPQIKELNKPVNAWCVHASPGRGCKSYAGRPVVCRSFYCRWMLDASFGPEWKPDKSKFIVYLSRGGGLSIAVDTDFPNAWTRPPYYAQIKKWAMLAEERKEVVVVRVGHRLIVVLPDRDVDLGQVDEEADLIVSRRPGPQGTDYQFKVKLPEMSDLQA